MKVYLKDGDKVFCDGAILEYDGVDYHLADIVGDLFVIAEETQIETDDESRPYYDDGRKPSEPPERDEEDE